MQVEPVSTDAPPAPVEKKDEVADFTKTILESKQQIAAVDAQNFPKRKRGQRGPGKKKLKVLGATAPNENKDPQALAEAAKKESIAPLLVNPLIFVSSIPANTHKIPELALTKEEALACAESLNKILNAFVPDMEKMDPKTAAVFGGLATCGTIIFVKYSIYLDKTKDLAPPAPPTEQEINAEAQQVSGVDAESYFSRTQSA